MAIGQFVKENWTIPLMTVGGTPFKVARNNFTLKMREAKNDWSSVTLTDHLPQVPLQGLRTTENTNVSTAVKS